MSLHDRIMGMTAPDNVAQHPLCMGGFSVAQQEAAQLAKAADELMAEMAKCLEHMPITEVRAAEVLDKYRAYEGQTK